MVIAVLVGVVVSVGVSVHASWARAGGESFIPKQKDNIIPTSRLIYNNGRNRLLGSAIIVFQSFANVVIEFRVNTCLRAHAI
jgi:hypothetical protein